MDTNTVEAAALGIILAKPDLCADLFARVPVTDFNGPNALVAEAVYGLYVAHRQIDPITVNQELARRGTLGRVGAALTHEMFSLYTSEVMLPGYLDEIVRVSRLRRLERIGVTVAARSQSPEADPGVIARLALESAQGVLDHLESDGDIDTPTLREFLDVPDAEYDWVIPGLLERGDRLILTGSEGLGKSVMFRQLAVAAAAGAHPFTGGAMTPQRVLYVDVENSAGHLRRELRPLATTGRIRGNPPDDRLFLECRPEGLDLTKPEDEAWLVKRVATLQPSLLLTGPLYRLHADDPNKEQPARQVARVLDRCRSAAHCAVVVEAHAGHGTGHGGERNVRPTGSSLWLRWPEYGYGMRAADGFHPKENRLVDLVPWRGDRAVREWPKQLRAGGPWPWSEVYTERWGDAA